MGERKCTCRPIVMHHVGCPIVSPYGVCEFCKESKNEDGSCNGCWEDGPALAPTQPGAPRTETANERKTDDGD